MYMNSAPHLLSEDRPEFERVLDEALHDEDTRQAVANAAAHLNSEQLRTLALGATAAIAACAAAEYEEYLRIREQVREAATTPHRDSRPHEPPADGSGDGSGDGAGDAGEGPGDAAGAGLTAMVAVLAPILAAAAAAIFLCFGYLLELMSPDPSIAAPLRTAGWVFALLAGAGIVVGVSALLLTAVRNTSADAGALRVANSPEVAAARERWRRALLERGVRPYLHRVLASGPAGELTARQPEEPVRRTPPLGYSRPGFSSPSPVDPTAPRRGPEFTSPDFTSPDFSSPDFSSPDFDTGSPDQPGADRA
jgi:hypothetical protein